MKKEIFNSAAKWALLLGVVMSASRIYEASVMVSGDMMRFATMTLEWIAAVVIYFWIIYKANKSEARKALPEQGYSMRQSLNYSILISALAAVIIGVASHIYVVNVIGGYTNYALQSAESMITVIREAKLSGDLLEFYEKNIEAIRQAGDNPPSFLSTVISMVANYVIVGFFVGLITGLFTRRRPVVNNAE